MEHVSTLSAKDRDTILFIDNCSSAKYRGFVSAYDDKAYYGSPSEIFSATQEFSDAVTVALLPVATLPDMRSNFIKFGNYGISSDGATQSVILFSHHEISELLRRSMPICLTQKSMTSRRLLAQLTEMSYDAPLNICQYEQGASAHLLIGDDAISMSNQGTFAYSRDLSAWWKKVTGYPFVFAHWMVNRRASLSRTNELLSVMSDTLGRARNAALYSRLADASDGAFGIEFWRQYHRNIREQIDERGYQGMSKFLDHLRAANLELDGAKQ